MTKREQTIYNLLFVTRITLKDLIDTIYLENYKHIEIYKRGLLISVDLTFRVGAPGKHVIMYTYDFDSESGLLMKIRQTGGSLVTYEVIYDRIKEYKKLIGNDWHEARRAVIKEMNKR